MSSPHSPRKIHLVGSRIRELRKGHHLTQTELSEKIGIAQSDLSRMEQGEYKVGLDTLFKILHVFDLKMGEFFGETEKVEDGRARELVGEFLELSSEAQREVRDFVR
ncbi:MAG TPA: helix-turn-helix transcriptional regulator, partial [Thermoanaerobaculia bacterium]